MFLVYYNNKCVYIVYMLWSTEQFFSDLESFRSDQSSQYNELKQYVSTQVKHYIQIQNMTAHTAIDTISHNNTIEEQQSEL